MTSSSNFIAAQGPGKEARQRMDYLDATRAFALVLGVVFHASMSFMPAFIGWAVQDVSTSPLISIFMMVSHAFRLETFFLLAGFFSHLTFHRMGAGEFIRSRLVRIVTPFVVGWFLLRPLLISGWIMGSASIRGTVDVWASLRGGFQSLSTLPSGIFTGTHLWFLYYLAIITTLTLLARGLMSGRWKAPILRRGDAAVEWLAASSVRLLALVIPTAGALWFMGAWGMDTPDRSLAPRLPVLLIYGGFFVFGWMLSRERDLITRFAALTPARWLQAATGITTILLLGGIERDPAHPRYFAAHVGYALGYALTMWSLVFLTAGIFQKICRRPNPVIRYVADSSYWMYLIHLPVVIWLQVAVAELPLNWSIKLAFVATVTIAISLLTYDLFVRSTIIGKILNGRRRNRAIVTFLFNGAPSEPRGADLSSAKTAE